MSSINLKAVSSFDDMIFHTLTMHIIPNGIIIRSGILNSNIIWTRIINSMINFLIIIFIFSYLKKSLRVRYGTVPYILFLGD